MEIMNINKNLQSGGGKCKYSVITPVFNRSDCIGRCIESVIRNLNENINIEHIIVDDGSSDDTVKIIREYLNKYCHIKFIQFSSNKGTNAARNAAISIAAGEFCVILDSDDYFVDDALEKINSAIQNKEKYGHYLFVPNDRIDYLNQNLLLKGRDFRVLHFVDFLNNCISGDFIHVIKTATLKKYPFDEELRIYEGVFFLKFYKDAQKIFFVNEIVTIRERDRADSVSKDFLRTSIDIINRAIRSQKLWIKWFECDCLQLGLQNLVCNKYMNLFENHLLANDYPSAKVDIIHIRSYNGHVPMRLKIVYYLQCGWIYRSLLKIYLSLKYNFLNLNLRS